MTQETQVNDNWSFDPTEIERHYSIDIWDWHEGGYQRNRIIANVKCVAPIWLPGGNDLDVEAMNKATIARANLFCASEALLEKLERALPYLAEGPLYEHITGGGGLAAEQHDELVASIRAVIAQAVQS